jgi:hypothetical protein
MASDYSVGFLLNQISGASEIDCHFLDKLCAALPILQPDHGGDSL